MQTSQRPGQLPITDIEDLKRCEREVAAAHASEGPAYLYAMAEADWRIEADLIREGC